MWGSVNSEQAEDNVRWSLRLLVSTLFRRLCGELAWARRLRLSIFFLFLPTRVFGQIQQQLTRNASALIRAQPNTDS